MKTIMLAAASATALFALSACDNAAEPTDEATPIVTETMLDTPASVAAGNEAAAQDTSDSISIGPDGVDATIRDGDTTVNVDTNGQPSVDVEVN